MGGPVSKPTLWRSRVGILHAAACGTCAFAVPILFPLWQAFLCAHNTETERELTEGGAMLVGISSSSELGTQALLTQDCRYLLESGWRAPTQAHHHYPSLVLLALLSLFTPTPRHSVARRACFARNTCINCAVFVEIPSSGGRGRLSGQGRGRGRGRGRSRGLGHTQGRGGLGLSRRGRGSAGKPSALPKPTQLRSKSSRTLLTAKLKNRSDRKVLGDSSMVNIGWSLPIDHSDFPPPANVASHTLRPLRLPPRSPVAVLALHGSTWRVGDRQRRLLFGPQVCCS